jgi:lipopolysaccharide exporter
MLSRLMKFLAKLKKSYFFRNVLIVMSGTALAQVLGYALSPVISRLYSPSDFGIFGSFNAVLNVIAAGVTLDYSMAIMLPRSKNDAFSLFMLSCLTTVGLAGVASLACLIAPAAIMNILKAPYMWLLALFVVAIFANGLNQACQAWCVRSKAFKQTSASQVIRSLTTNGTQIGLGYLKGGAPALISTAILGDVLATFNLARVVFRDFKILKRDFHWGRLKQLAYDYRDFPYYSASRNIINSLSLGLPVFLLTHYYGIAAAGAYAFGMKILSTPMEFVLRALRQVLYQKASETHNEGGRLVPLYFKITGGLFAIAFIPALILVLWAPRLFSWIFGSQWHLAGIFAQGLIVWLMFMFCNLPAVLFARIIRMQRKLFFFDLLVLASRALVLVLGGIYLQAPTTILMFSIVGAIMNLSFVFMVGIALSKSEGESSFRELVGRLKEE